MFISIDVEQRMINMTLTTSSKFAPCQLRAGWNLKASNLKSDSNEGTQT